jgi:sarcosine oxidase, subunit gamma
MLDVDPYRAVMEISSWLPEHKSGEKGISLNGRELSREIGTTQSGAPRVLHLSPGKWLIVSDEDTPASFAERFTEELAVQGAVLIDMTDGVAVSSIRGPKAREVLSKGCGLDLQPTAFPVGRCARTRFAQLSVIIEHVDDAPHYRLYVARSCLRYLIDWIGDAAVEFQDCPE